MIKARLLLLGVSTLLLLLVLPFFNAIIGGVLIAYLFKPLNDSILKAVKNGVLSASLSTIVSILVLLSLNYLFLQTAITSVIQMQNLLDTNLISLSAISSSLLGSLTLSSDMSNIFSFFYGLIRLAPKSLIDLIILSSVCFYMFKDFDALKRAVVSLDKNLKITFFSFFKRLDYLIKSFLYGHILVALLTSLLVFLASLFLGLPFPLELLTMSFVIAVFPFTGAWLLTLILSVYYFLTANYLTSTILLLVSIVLFLIDRNIKVMLHQQNDINHLFLILGLLGGVSVFGVYGFIAGPVLLCIFQAVLETFSTPLPSLS